jgi:hypothetical protein
MYIKSSTREKTMNVRENLELMIWDLIFIPLMNAGLDPDTCFVETLEPECDEVLRFEVLVEDGDEDLLVVADGIVDYDFNLILTILEEN